MTEFKHSDLTAQKQKGTRYKQSCGSKKESKENETKKKAKRKTTTRRREQLELGIKL